MTDEEDMKPIPDMMFAPGEEPLGVRVLTYQSSEVTINRILSALDVEEVDYLRRSAFGKFIEIGEKPVFSGRFGRFLLSRQLKTMKKHEIWFRFAGKPVRFSLREFAIVTGLPCGRYPRNVKTKMKETMSEESYWPTLFGKSNVVTVHEVMKMLLRRSVVDRIIRIKYACLVILSAVILPTSLKMKIAREHAEAIEDLDEFFKFLWGRMAFDLLITSIKERDEIALSQNNIALKGFVHAIQLVMVEAVPAITEVGQDSSYGSEGESEFDVDGGGDLFPKKRTLNPAHARSVDKKCEVSHI